MERETAPVRCPHKDGYLSTCITLLLVILGTLACARNATSLAQGSAPPDADFSNATDMAAGDAASGAQILSPTYPVAGDTPYPAPVQVMDLALLFPSTLFPAGITYAPGMNRLLLCGIAIGETHSPGRLNFLQVDLMGSQAEIVSIATLSWFNALTKGPLLSRPTGLTLNLNNGHLLLTDNQARRILDLQPGMDEVYGSADDVITSFYKTTAFGSHDPQGIAFDSQQNTLYIADGPTGKVFKLTPGPNAIFDAPAPAGDDQVTEFDTARLGLHTPMGIAFNPDHNTLYVVGQDPSIVLELTSGGTWVRTVDISFLDLRSPAGVAYAPGSMNPAEMNLYILEQGGKNGGAPSAKESRIFEITLPPLSATIREGLLRTASPGKGPTIPADQPTPTPSKTK